MRVAALSVDTEEQAAGTVQRHDITFPVGYGADAHVVAEALQSYLHEDPPYLESSGFVIDPTGNVAVAVYSSNAIGRLMPDDVRGLVRYLAQQNAA
jgi:peroxiredoxin